MQYVKPERIWLKDPYHPELDEKWVHKKIDEDPSILGLGNLIVKDKERRQPGAGRLDMLLQDPDTYRRYEVEVQLGATDESHIIRTIEYWDIERKRYPQYEHSAVLVAEDVTSRFLNVVSLFNGAIPLIAIQFQALKIGEYTSLVFTTVMDELTRGLVDEDEDTQESVDRAYWIEKKGTKDTVGLGDQLLEMVREFEPDIALNYTKFYIGLSKNGQSNSSIQLRPQKKRLLLGVRLQRSQKTEEHLAEKTDLDFAYNRHRHSYEIKLNKSDIENHGDVLKQLMNSAYERKTHYLFEEIP